MFLKRPFDPNGNQDLDSTDVPTTARSPSRLVPPSRPSRRHHSRSCHLRQREWAAGPCRQCCHRPSLPVAARRNPLPIRSWTPGPHRLDGCLSSSEGRLGKKIGISLSPEWQNAMLDLGDRDIGRPLLEERGLSFFWPFRAPSLHTEGHAPPRRAAATNPGRRPTLFTGA